MTGVQKCALPIYTLKDVEDYLMSMVDQSRFTKEAYGMIDCRVIWRFLRSDLGKRMSLAQKEGRLSKEQQFVMGIPAKDMGKGDSEELVLIQGIIDAWIEEPEGLVLIDYKTDRVNPGDEELLISRYGTQLDYYSRALEQIKKKPVREKILYSLTLQKSICL